MMDGARNPDNATHHRLYSTGQLADDAGLTARTIRFYEGRGLLHPQFYLNMLMNGLKIL